MKKWLLSPLGFLCSAAIGFSQPAIFDVLVPKAKSVVANCSSFNGNWKGRCDITSPSGSSSIDKTRSIQQLGCAVLMEGGNTTILDGLSVLTISPERTGVNAGTTTTTAANWNADKTQINLHSNFTAMYQGADHSTNFSTDTTMQLNGAFFLEHSTSGEVTSNCVFERQ